MPLQKLYSVEEIAQMTSVTTRTIRNYLRNGILKGKKIGGQWRFSLEDIEAMINQTNGTSLENSRRIVPGFYRQRLYAVPAVHFRLHDCRRSLYPRKSRTNQQNALRPVESAGFARARFAMTTLRTRRPPAIRSSRRLNLCRQNSPFFRRKPKRD